MPLDIISMANASEGIRGYQEAKQRGDTLDMQKREQELRAFMAKGTLEHQRQQLLQGQQRIGLQERQVALQERAQKPLTDMSTEELKDHVARKDLEFKLYKTARDRKLLEEQEKIRTLTPSEPGGEAEVTRVSKAVAGATIAGAKEAEVKATEQVTEPFVTSRLEQVKAAGALATTEVGVADLKLGMLQQDAARYPELQDLNIEAMQARIASLIASGKEDEADALRSKAITDAEQQLLPYKIKELVQGLAIGEERKALLQAQAQSLLGNLAIAQDMFKLEEGKAGAVDPNRKVMFDKAIDMILDATNNAMGNIDGVHDSVSSNTAVSQIDSAKTILETLGYTIEIDYTPYEERRLKKDIPGTTPTITKFELPVIKSFAPKSNAEKGRDIAMKQTGGTVTEPGVTTQSRDDVVNKIVSAMNEVGFGRMSEEDFKVLRDSLNLTPAEDAIIKQRLRDENQ